MKRSLNLTRAHGPREVPRRGRCRRFCLRTTLIAALVGFAGGGVRGQDFAKVTPRTSVAGQLAELPLDQLLNVQFDTVYTASRREQRTWEAPAAVSIVGRDEIKMFGYRTLGEVLRSAPGVYLTDDRYYSYLGLRGFSRPGDYNSRALLQVNGHRANDNLYDSALIGQEALVDVDDIERVEIIRGPASSLYGSSAFFGVINVITRRGVDVRGVEASVEGGSLDTYKGRLTAGHEFASGVDAMVSASYYDSAGNEKLYFREFDAPESNNGIARDLDYERAWHVLTTLSYRDFVLSGAFNDRTRGIPNGSYGSYFNSQGSETWDRAGYVDLKFERDLPGDTHLLARVGLHHYDYRGRYPYNQADPGDPPLVVPNRDDAAGEWWGVEVLATRTFFERVTVTGGAELRDNFKQDQLNYDEGRPPSVYVNSHGSGVVVGTYAQADWSILTNLILSAGVRYDHYSTVGSTVNPRVGLVYRPWDPTTLKLVYGRAFRAPNAYETDYAAPGYTTAPDLDPEKIQTYEMMWEQAVRGPVRTGLSAFYYDVQDLIGLDYSQPLVRYRNLSSARAYGMETSVEGRWTNGWMARVSYTAQRAEDGDTGDELSNAPRHLGKLHVRLPLVPDRVFAGAEVLYGGSVSAVQSGRVDDYWLVNVTLLARELVPGLELSATIYNLLDAEWAVTGGEEHRQRVLQQNGRMLRLKLTYHF